MIYFMIIIFPPVFTSIIKLTKIKEKCNSFTFFWNWVDSDLSKKKTLSHVETVLYLLRIY